MIYTYLTILLRIPTHAHSRINTRYQPPFGVNNTETILAVTHTTRMYDSSEFYRSRFFLETF